MISVITWVNNEKLYAELRDSCKFEAEFIKVGQEARSLAEAYNIGTAKATGDILIYCHQDIKILDPNFDKTIEIATADLKTGFVGPIGNIALSEDSWWNAGPMNCRGKVLVPGVCQTTGNLDSKHLSSDFDGKWLTFGEYDGPARQLDGLLLATKQRFVFPEQLPGIHFLDVWVCKAAEQQGFTNRIFSTKIYHSSVGEAQSASYWLNYGLYKAFCNGSCGTQQSPQKTKKRYVISTPAYTHKSGGIVALYRLQKALILNGCDCICYSWKDDDIAAREITEDDIVIYPEVVEGNPIRAKKVVRWLLNVPGGCGPSHGDKFAPTDLIFCYLERFKYPGMKGLLFVPILAEGVTDLGLSRDYDCVWFHKGSWKPQIPLNAIEIPCHAGKPMTDRFYRANSKKDLLEFLQHCKTLYSYDDITALADEAKLSGCDVKLINANGSIIPYPFTALPSPEEAQKQLEDFIAITQAL